MTQEVQSQSLTAGSPGNESWNIGDGVARIPCLNDPKIGNKRRERIVGNLGARGGHRCNQRGFTCRGVADKGNIGNRLEFKNDIVFFPWLSKEREPGSLSLFRGERRIAQASSAAFGNDESTSRTGEVSKELTAL